MLGFELLLIDKVVLLEMVIDPHISSEIDCRQLRLHTNLLRQSLQILMFLLDIEKRMISIKLNFFLGMSQNTLVGCYFLHCFNAVIIDNIISEKRL